MPYVACCTLGLASCLQPPRKPLGGTFLSVVVVQGERLVGLDSY